MEKIIPAFLADQLFVMGLVLHNQREVEEEFLRYRAARGLEENRIAFANEVLFRIPAIKMAEIQSRFAETWMYYFTWPSAVPGLSACHAIELPFVFNTLKSRSCIEFTGGAPPQEPCRANAEDMGRLCRIGESRQFLHPGMGQV
jgi:carboxylesterase type B